MNKITRVLKQILLPLVIATLYLATTAGSCSSTDNRPPLASKYPEKCDIELDPVFLRYNLEKFVNDCQKNGYAYPSSDIQELIDYNNVMVASSWLDFYSLFISAGGYTGTGPEVKFIFSQPDCKGNISIVYKQFDDKLCNHRIIANAPKINKIHLVEFSANTIKTSQNNISIKWNNAYTVTGYGTYMNIDEQGTVDHPSFIFTRGTKGGLEIAARLIGNKYEVVENTVSDEVSPGYYNVAVVEDNPTIIGSMQKNVCTSGALNQQATWDSPSIVELQ